jgi:hypothetical protein
MGALLFYIAGFNSRVQVEKEPTRTKSPQLNTFQMLVGDQGSLPAVLAASFLLFKFENIAQLGGFSLRSRLWCHNAINRIFTSTTLRGGRTTCIFHGEVLL